MKSILRLDKVVFDTNIETKIVEYVDTYVGVDYVSTGGKTINCLGDSITEGYKNRIF